MTKTRTRVIALILAIITAISVGSSLVFTATAVTTKSTVSTSKEIEDEDENDDLDEDDDEKLFYVDEDDEGGAEFETDGQYWKDAAGEVIYEMIYRCIDHLADSSWVGSVFSMGGLVVFKSIYDAINPKNNEPSPDTKLVLDAVEKLSDKVSENHNEAMKAFDKLDMNVSTQGFRSSIDDLTDSNKQVVDSLKQYSIKTDTKSKDVISKSQYNAYVKALKNAELDFSTLQKKLTSVNNFLKGYKYQNEKNPGYISYVDYLLTKVSEKNASHTFSKAADLKTAAKGMKREIKSMQGTCIAYGATLAEITHLQYKVDEYEQAQAEKNASTEEEKEDAADLKKQMTDTRDERLKQIKDMTDVARKYYKKAIIYINRAGVAKVKIGEAEKTFPSFGDAWGTAMHSGKKFTVTLIKDVTADAARGLNEAGLGSDYGFNGNGGLIAKDDKEEILDLNKHKIDCTRKAFTFADIELNSNITIKNGTITNATRIINFDNTDKDKSAKITIDNVKMLGCKNNAIYFNCYKDTTLTLKNSEISNTAKGCAIYVKWHLKYQIENTAFNNNKGEYGAAMHGTYATDGSYLRKCSFTGNEADKSGGALYSVYNVSDSTFKNNKAKDGKGGAFAYWGSVTNCTFEGNTATDQGGAVWVQADVNGCTFKNNSANGNGGALFVQSKNKTVNGCKFEGNSGHNGGALAYDYDGNCTKNCTFKGNKASGDGGGLYIPTDQNGKVESCTFESNTAGSDGGAISVCAHTDLTLTGSTITNNRAHGKGGGVYLGALSFNDHHFTNVTITGNWSDVHGSGIYCNTMTAAAADVAVHGSVIIRNNGSENAYMVQAAGKKAMFYTKSNFDSGRSSIYVCSSTNSDIAVVDLNMKAHEGAFHSDKGRRLYRGSWHNYTLYLDTWNGGSIFTPGFIALIGGGVLLIALAAATVIILKRRKKKALASETDSE
jgi:parallel beta-helix repeat protein/predicted outer membrane repeat protein